MNKDNAAPANDLPPSTVNSLFSNITDGIIRTLIDAAFRGIFLYLIWNFTLAQELHLPELSYFFCAFAVLFLNILLNSPKDSAIIFQLLEINKNLTALNDLTRFKMTMDILSGSKTEKNLSESNTDSMS